MLYNGDAIKFKNIANNNNANTIISEKDLLLISVFVNLTRING